jgi:aminoglycoside/choline kinase family phosphotransferase
MDVLRRQFERHFGSPPQRIEPVQGGLGGSGRTIVRLANEQHSAIGVVNDVRAENVAFLEFSRHFHRLGLPVPEIYADDLKAGAYLQEDLGEVTLFDFLRQHRESAKARLATGVAADYVAPEVFEIYRRAVEVLPRFQVEAGLDLNYRHCYPRSSFDRQSIGWDLNYFKYYFLRLAGVPFHEEELEKDFGRLVRFLLTADRKYFLYRDFQSRNIMVRRGAGAVPPSQVSVAKDATRNLGHLGQSNERQPWFIDYQGGRRGALQYDIASILFDAKADLPPALREQLLAHYLDALGEFLPLDREAFLRHYYAYVYVRVMQALGAYGFRGYYERKPHFLESVPYALKNVRWLLGNAELPIKLPALMAAFAAMTEAEPVKALEPELTAEAAAGAAAQGSTSGPTSAPEAAVLTVLINSFSFHRGPLADECGHGGGFVFDARALPNPGREERFKRLSGLDAAVIEYLKQQPGVEKFLSSTMELIEASVCEYQRRGFQHLMVSFGCTGGQHRSVYLAEEVAKRLDGRDGLRVVVRHRERENWVR